MDLSASDGIAGLPTVFWNIADLVLCYPGQESHAWTIPPLRWLAQSRFRHCSDMVTVHLSACCPPPSPPPTHPPRTHTHHHHTHTPTTTTHHHPPTHGTSGYGPHPRDAPNGQSTSPKRCGVTASELSELIRFSSSTRAVFVNAGRSFLMRIVHAIKLLRVQASMLSRPKRIQWPIAPTWHRSGRNQISSTSDAVIYCGMTNRCSSCR